MSRVSHSRMRCHDAVVPSRPIAPVFQGERSSITPLPSRAVATPAPSRLAISVSSVEAPSAPAPARIATFSPAFSTSAAASRAASGGAAIAEEGTAEVW